MGKVKWWVEVGWDPNMMAYAVVVRREPDPPGPGGAYRWSIMVPEEEYPKFIVALKVWVVDQMVRCADDEKA